MVVAHLLTNALEKSSFFELGDQLLHEIREARRAKNVEMSTLYIERRPANDPATSR